MMIPHKYSNNSYTANHNATTHNTRNIHNHPNSQEENQHQQKHQQHQQLQHNKYYYIHSTPQASPAVINYWTPATTTTTTNLVMNFLQVGHDDTQDNFADDALYWCE